MFRVLAHLDNSLSTKLQTLQASRALKQRQPDASYFAVKSSPKMR